MTAGLAIMILCLISSLTAWFAKSSPTYMRVFSIFLLVAVCVETFGSYLSSHSISNVLLYNIFTTVEFTTYFYVLRSIIVGRKVRNIVVFFFILYVVAYVRDLFFFHKSTDYNSISYTVGSLFIVLLCVYYFFELFQLPKTIDLIREPAFWLVTGILFYYCLMFPFFGLVNFIRQMPRLLMNRLIMLVTFINVLIYSLYIIAFLCKIKVRRYISSS